MFPCFDDVEGLFKCFEFDLVDSRKHNLRPVRC